MMDLALNGHLLLVLVSLILSAFFSGMEMAFTSSNKLIFELEKKENGIRNRFINIFYKNPQQFLSTLLVGNIICLLVFTLEFIYLVEFYLGSYTNSSLELFLYQLLLASFCMLFFGEFIPKTMAKIHPSFSLYIFSPLLFLAYIILYPLVKLFNYLSFSFLRMFGIKLEFNNAYHHFGREDLDDFLQETITNTHKDSSIDKEVKFFQNALDFSQVKLKNCIVPRIEIVALDKRESRDELLLRFIETGLSKIVVYDDDLDNILGYIHSSELFKNPTDWTQHIKALPMVPENMSASKLLKRMLLEQNSMAVVVDEFGSTSGLITMEDLVEEIFGDIEDEHDTRSLIAKKISPTEFVLAGRMEVDKINEMFDLKIPESEEYTTVAGCILTAHERFPEFNEIISIDKYSFQIIKMSATKIELLRMKVNK